MRRRLPWISREHLYIYGPACLLTVLAFVVALRFVSPAPPRHIVIATGGQDGAYYQFGLRYRELLAREGITLDVRSTSGSVDNVRLLEDAASGVDVAFVQGGVLAPESPGLLSLGTVYLEPIWIFSRAPIHGLDVAGLAGKRLAVGPEGSGTRMLADRLLDANGVTEASARRLPVTGNAAQEALRRGTADAAFFVVAAQAPMIRDVVRVPGLRLMSFSRADAYTRRFPFLVKVVLPQGALDLASDIPPRDTVLLASAVNLVVRKSFHPALSSLLLMSATTIHGGPGLFEKAGDFPSPQHADVPLSPEARRYYQSGPSFLNRYLPFWMATSIDRLKVMLVPLIALMFPLFRIVPPLYRWRVRSKIYRWYHDLAAIDRALAGSQSVTDRGAIEGDIDRVEREVRGVVVPASYQEELYHLRAHIELLRAKVRGASKPPELTL
jgi:TRAP transporter TAXI family solute receptor